jgi:hypothetical protein
MQKQVFFFERLKREVGAIPTRSRHCKWEHAAGATVRTYGKEQQAMTMSQETCLILMHQQTYEDREVCGSLLFSENLHAMPSILMFIGDAFFCVPEDAILPLGHKTFCSMKFATIIQQGDLQ